MDMNWQAMLHEAADASFEKNIESLAAADNDACSYADLPKAKIQELSEKILYLPHQGIVLLFSRYCFRLSPKEAEKFFQLENAKGRFRFYRELLSSNMGFSSAQVISDDSLNQACRIAMKTYLRMELKEDPAANSAGMLMYGKEASNRKQEIDRQHYTIPNQRPKDKHCGKI